MADAVTVSVTSENFERLKSLAELNEKQVRLVVGMFCSTIGYGGQKQVAAVFGMGLNTVRTGCLEFEGKTPSAVNRVRRPGAGRKSTESSQPGLVEATQELLENNSYGDPERVLFWTTLSLRDIEEKLAQKGFKASYVTIGRIISQLGFSKQLNQKLLQVGEPHPDRDGQFKFIEDTVQKFLKRGDPVISVDCKKKEILGNFKNNGREYRHKKDPRPTFDHDFLIKELGKVAPYGVYVLNDNTGFVNLTQGSDTSEFAVQSIRSWWYQVGRINFPNAKRILITCDGGGSNGWRVRLWKEQIAVLAAETGIEFTICHFPPGTSKWNKIEHRLFCYISRNWEGKPLLDIETVVEYISNTTTKAGLKVQCVTDPRSYASGIKVTDEQMADILLEPLGEYGRWNYRIRGFKSSLSSKS